MIKQCWILAAMIVAATLTGCDTGHGMRAPKAGDLLVSAKAADQLQYRIQWPQNLSLPRGASFDYIEPMGELLTTVDSSRIMTVIRTSDGQAVWAKQVGTSAETLTAPRRGEGWICITTESTAYVYRISDGELVRKQHLAHVAATAPAIDGNYAIYGSPTGIVFAEDLSRGFEAWTYAGLNGGIVADPLRVEGTVIVCDSTGSVAAFDATRGNLLWRSPAPPWQRISASPVGNESFIYVASEDQGLYGFERTSGRAWKYVTESPLTTSPVLVVDRVFQDVPSEGILCFDAYTGEALWRAKGVHGRVVMVTKQEKVLVAQDQKLLMLDAESGEVVGTVELPGVAHIVADNTLAGNLYMAADNGRMLKLSPRP